ncbi:MAG: hypothetical protein ABIK67_01325 [candidate division WOR-3 bacterium]
MSLANIKVIRNAKEFKLDSVYCVFLIYLNCRYFDKGELNDVYLFLRWAIEEISRAEFIQGREFFTSKDVCYLIYYGYYKDFYKINFFDFSRKTKTMFQNYIWGMPIFTDESYYKFDFTYMIKKRNGLDHFLFHMLLHYFRHKEWDETNRCYLEKRLPKWFIKEDPDRHRKYEVYLSSREYEIIAEDFDFEKYYHGFYDSRMKLDLDREAWVGSTPLYLHYIGTFEPNYLIEKAKGIVTTKPIFAIFDKENLTFAEMIQEIWKRRKEIVKVTEGDDNPYE